LGAEHVHAISRHELPGFLFLHRHIGVYEGEDFILEIASAYFNLSDVNAKADGDLLQLLLRRRKPWSCRPTFLQSGVLRRMNLPFVSLHL
jgi:hypothetical protein